MENRLRFKTCIKPFLGTLICVLSSIMMSFVKIIAKELKHISPFTICCIQFMTLSILALPRSACKIYSEEAKITKLDWFFLFLRGCIGATNNIIIIYSLQVSSIHFLLMFWTLKVVVNNAKIKALRVAIISAQNSISDEPRYIQKVEH